MIGEEVTLDRSRAYLTITESSLQRSTLTSRKAEAGRSSVQSKAHHTNFQVQWPVEWRRENWHPWDPGEVFEIRWGKGKAKVGATDPPVGAPGCQRLRQRPA